MITIERKHGNTYTRDVSAEKKIVRPSQPNTKQKLQANNSPLDENKTKHDKHTPQLKMCPKRSRTPVVRHINIHI